MQLSGAENGKRVQSIYTGELDADPYLVQSLPTRTVTEDGRSAWCGLWFEAQYQVEDPENTTVGQRDRAITGFQTAVRVLGKAPFEDLLRMETEDVVSRLQSFVAESSTSGIMFYLNEQSAGRNIAFEHTDEQELSIVRGEMAAQ